MADAPFHRSVNIIPNAPRPVSPIVRVNLQPPENPEANGSADSPFVMKGRGIMSGNARAMFIGIMGGALLLSAVSVFFQHQERKQLDPISGPKLLHAATRSLSNSLQSTAPPAPLIVQLSPDIVRVSAIALGHPRLAVINGRSVAEGDIVTVHTPTRSVALSLRVVKIADGRIELSDGTQLIVARLSLPGIVKAEH